MNKLWGIIKRHKIVTSILFTVVMVTAVLGVQIAPVTTHVPKSSVSIGQIGQKYDITIGSGVDASTTADYTATGTAAQQTNTFQIALNALPTTGGILTILSGNYTLNATITRAIPNVTIEGIGNSTIFSDNGSLPIFTAGSTGWNIQNVVLDAGGISGTWTGSNITIGSTYYAVYGTFATGRTATYVIAASNSSALDKSQADAVCSGTNDNLVVQTGMNSLIAAGGGTLHLDYGGYYFTDQVTDNTGSYIVLEGAGWGTQVIWTTGTNVTGKYLFSFGTSGTPVMRCQVQNIFLTCNGPSVTGGSALYAYGTPINVTNCKIDNFNQYGLCLDSHSEGGYISYNNIVANPAASGAMDIFCNSGCLGLWIDHNSLSNAFYHNTSTETGIYLNGSTSLQIMGIHIENNYFNGGLQNITGTEVWEIYIYDNVFPDANHNAIQLQNGSGNHIMSKIQIVDNVFYDWGFANAATCYAINILPQDSTYNCVDLQIEGNYFDGASTANSAINLNYANRYSNGLIANNHFSNLLTAVTIPILPTSVSVLNNPGSPLTPSNPTGCILNLSGQNSYQGATYNDVSGNYNNGIVSNGQWIELNSGLWTQGFNGSSSVVSVSNSGGIFTPVNFSFVTWIKFTSYSNDPVISSTKNTTYNQANGWWFSYNHINQALLMRGSDGNGIFSTAVNLSLNTWYMVCVTVSGTTASFYVNGVAASSGSIAQVASNTDALYLGRASNDYPSWLSGYETMPRFLTGVVLTSAQLTAMYNQEAQLFS